MTSFRVTHNTLQQTSLAGLQLNLARSQRLQEELSSGKQVSRPSDGPTQAVDAMRYRSALSRNDQYSRNAQDGLSWLGLADSSLTQSLDLVGRARELLVRAANGTTSADDRAAAAEELENLRNGMIDLANTRYLDRPIFAGTAGTDKAYSSTGTYLGDNGSVPRAVGNGVTVVVNITGNAAFGTGSSNVFGVLDQAIADLRSTNPADNARIGTSDLGALDGTRVGIENALAQVGARYHQVEMMQGRSQDADIQLKNSLSEVEDIDLPKTMVDMQLQEVAYKAALAATSRVIQPSLVDFLR